MTWSQAVPIPADGAGGGPERQNPAGARDRDAARLSRDRAASLPGSAVEVDVPHELESRAGAVADPPADRRECGQIWRRRIAAAGPRSRSGRGGGRTAADRSDRRAATGTARRRPAPGSAFAMSRSGSACSMASAASLSHGPLAEGGFASGSHCRWNCDEPASGPHRRRRTAGAAPAEAAAAGHSLCRACRRGERLRDALAKIDVLAPGRRAARHQDARRRRLRPGRGARPAAQSARDHLRHRRSTILRCGRSKAQSRRLSAQAGRARASRPGPAQRAGSSFARSTPSSASTRCRRSSATCARPRRATRSSRSKPNSGQDRRGFVQVPLDSIDCVAAKTNMSRSTPRPAPSDARLDPSVRASRRAGRFVRVHRRWLVRKAAITELRAPARPRRGRAAHRQAPARRPGLWTALRQLRSTAPRPSG